jgi:hypothetical protein
VAVDRLEVVALTAGCGFAPREHRRGAVLVQCSNAEATE